MVDNGLRDHPKWLALSKTERCSLVELWMWIDAKRTDGKVPPHVPKAIGISPREIAKFLEIGWIHQNGSGWVVNDWHDWNAPQDPAEREKWFRRRRQRRKPDGEIDA